MLIFKQKLFRTKGFNMQKNYKVGKYALDNHQMQIINNDQNTLVIAGAGAGKTLTLLGKINYLLENKLCNSQEILIISFTNASVNDIKEKIKYNVNIFTFHKLAIEILKSANVNYNLCDENYLKYIVEESVTNCKTEDQITILKFLKLNIKYKSFLKSHYYISFCKLIITYINLFKTNNYTYDNIKNINFTKTEQKILIIIFNIYYQYCSEKRSTKKFDFDDLIICATNIIKNIKSNYKYIIIDEFQDTSLIRLNLIKELYKHTNSKIIVVGDDWQSIYRFSGCDLNIFLNFEKLFPNVKKIMLSNTYRNSCELISVASEFIQKNPLQIKKNLTSTKTNSAPLIFVPYLNKIYTFKKLIESILIYTNDIMILSRNNKDIFEYIDKDFKLEKNVLFYKNFPLKYYTVHRSKGLEASHVIILNCNNEYLGFPNKIENNPIIDKLVPNNEIRFAEERRLFYVAITRCKETTYLVYNKNSPSYFIKEIKKILKKNSLKIKYFK